MIANQFCTQNVVTETFFNIDDLYAVQWLNNDPNGQAYAQKIGLQTPINPLPTAECDQNTQPPVVRLNSPLNDQRLTQGMVTFEGQINAANLARYQIEYASVTDPENWLMIGQPGTTPQTSPNSPLAVWDTTLIPNGQYTVRLAAFSTTGGHIYRTANVTVDNPLPTSTPIPTVTPFSTALPPPTGIPFDPLGPPTPTIDPLG